MLTDPLVIQAARVQPMEQVWMIWDTMLRHGIEPDERHYEYLDVRLTNGGNLEMALQYLNEQGQKGKPVSLRAIRSVIRDKMKNDLVTHSATLDTAIEKLNVRCYVVQYTFTIIHSTFVSAAKLQFVASCIERGSSSGRRTSPG